ncbi:PREDICTED: growth hormone secretagogue receptor type 1-like [Branchiostoma belcheri]|uniref:Growth hormone secretagogue receptor type 1-like n=1 Tax=Branchiostoma belcheri TaxID=7741 RepID=A0A6P4YX91_BRABE|nr:PREDICTED: growth hormone secretagogue receptor type 1-like [Branchiostoma belcheri]
MRHVNGTERGEPVYPTFGEAFLYDNCTAGTALPPGYNSTLLFTIPQVELVLLTAVYALIFVVGVVGNLLVGVVVAKVRRMRSPTNYLLLNLSVADLLVLLVCVPAAIQETWVVSPWLLGEFMCHFIPYMEFSTFHASTLTVIAIGVERYYAICLPLSCKHVLSGGFIVRVMCALWAAAFLTAVPVFFVTEFSYDRGDDGELAANCVMHIDTFGGRLYLTASNVVFYFAPLAILSGLYVVISRNLREPELHQSIRQGSVARLRLQARRQVTYMLLAVVVVFFLCLLPYRTILMVMMYATPESLFQVLGGPALWKLQAFCRVMVFINSTVNPVLYNLTSSKFRQAFRTAFCDGDGDSDRGTEAGFTTRNSSRRHPLNTTTGNSTARSTASTSNGSRRATHLQELSIYSRSRQYGKELTVTDSTV